MAAAGAAAMTAACGSSAPPATSASAALGGTADHILALASAALATSSSYHVAGMLDAGLSVDLVVAPHALRGRLTNHGVTWDVVMVGGSVWFRGAELWAATHATAAASFGSGWVRVLDPGAGFGLAGRLPTLPQAIDGIVFGPHAGLRTVGPTTQGGRRAVELRSDKDVYDVALEGRPYPLRWLDGDIPGPGGAPCGVTLDSFDQPVAIAAPQPVMGTLAAQPGETSASPTPLVPG